MIADSSVWIDFFRGSATLQVARLQDAIVEGEVVVGDLIVCEVLQGFTSDAVFERARRDLAKFDTISIGGARVAVAAARNYRTLRSKGITPRKTIDTLIATRCILDRIPLLYADRDFDPFVEYLGLIPAIDAATGAPQ